VTGVNAAAKAAVSTSARSTVARIIAIPPDLEPVLSECLESVAFVGQTRPAEWRGSLLRWVLMCCIGYDAIGTSATCQGAQRMSVIGGGSDSTRTSAFGPFLTQAVWKRFSHSLDPNPT
jgi:hypothetical protein